MKEEISESKLKNIYLIDLKEYSLFNIITTMYCICFCIYHIHVYISIYINEVNDSNNKNDEKKIFELL